MNEKGKGKGKKESYYGLYFLGSVSLLYILLFLVKPASIQKALTISGEVLLQIAPVLVLIFVFMVILNYFVNPKTISKYVGHGSGIKGWLLAITTGMLSHGPIYIWYPLLKELQDHGMRNGLIAAFLYNRAIKLPHLPLMVYYFGSLFVALLLIYMVIASVIVGRLVEMIAE
jgi:uncharacterized membrane protein YraQ (UPF0718 family)